MNLEMSASIRDQEDQSKGFLIEIKENLEPEPASECCIYRVPIRLRMVNKKAYTPQLISIGPLHHGKKELADMEKRKTAYLKSFLKRMTIEKQKNILTFIGNNEQLIRNCYAETSKLESHEFRRMILYDAIFIIELFTRGYNCENDFFLHKPKMYNDLYLDMQLLENQLPYFVLDELYKLAFTSPDDPTFMDLSYHFFEDHPFEDTIDQLAEVKHFTDLKRTALLKSYPGLVKSKGQIVNLPCAVKLHESGVKFKQVERECLLDIRFEKRKQQSVPCFERHELQIPHLDVSDETESVLRNIMALEQCHYPDQTWICNYIDIMDRLIDTEKDVDLLIREGIISNYLGDNASVANMFNKLYQEVFVGQSCYYNICEELKAHYNNPWNHTKATLKSVYFSNLWRGTATIAAVILLLLTVIQTVCSILQVI